MFCFSYRLYFAILSAARSSTGGVRVIPAIFISHSSIDRKVSGDVKAALDRLGFQHSFLDFDKATGLGIGENWESNLASN